MTCWRSRSRRHRCRSSDGVREYRQSTAPTIPLEAMHAEHVERVIHAEHVLEAGYTTDTIFTPEISNEHDGADNKRCRRPG